jgi:redox-sensitive bicupin YhaK (pirin superfamily)
MKTILHKANSRGNANHGWLNSYHSFSFANYYNPERMGFGVLRVLNDDTVAGGTGFGAHPHANMEIVSIPLEGDLEHKDSMGNTTVIRKGDIQVMSAGTGVTHSEYNYSAEHPVKFLQIWVIPNKQNVAPRYDQITIKETAMQQRFLQILSPNKEDDGVWIYQNAWFHMGVLEGTKSLTYHWKAPGNGLYVFVLEGEVVVADQQLGRRDALGIWEVDKLDFKTSDACKLLLMEVPL